jgi:hypothetical protein
MLADKLTLVIHSCDLYSDLWDGHIQLLNQNWADRNLNTLLITDKITKKQYRDISIIPAGEGTEFSERSKHMLKYIHTKYVLVTLDDYYPVNIVNNNMLERLIDIMENENLDYIRLFPDPNARMKFKSYEKLYHIPLNVNYSVNLYQGIWRKEFIEKTIGTRLNAWQYEVSLTKIAAKLNAKCVLSKGKEFEILDVVRKGKILHRAARYFKKHNLYNGERKVISYAEEFRIFVFSKGKKILPRSVSITLKRLLKKLGVKFYSESI